MDSYDASSLIYNRLRRAEQLEKAHFIKWLVKPTASDKVLDVGCGTGISTSVFVKTSEVIGIDKNESMLKLNPYKNIKGSAENLPFKDEAFDIIVSVTCAQNFSSIHKAIREMKRVSKRIVAVSILSRSKKLKVLRNAVFKYFKDYKEYKINVDTLFLCIKPKKEPIEKNKSA